MTELSYYLELVTIEDQIALSLVLFGCQAEQIFFFLRLEPNFLVILNIPLDSFAVDLDTSCLFSFCLAFELYELFVEAIYVFEFVIQAGLFFFKIDFSQNCDIVLSHLFFLLSDLVLTLLYLYFSAHSILQVLKYPKEITDGDIQFVHLVENFVVDSADLKELLLRLLG